MTLKLRSGGRRGDGTVSRRDFCKRRDCTTLSVFIASKRPRKERTFYSRCSARSEQPLKHRDGRRGGGGLFFPRDFARKNIRTGFASTLGSRCGGPWRR